MDAHSPEHLTHPLTPEEMQMPINRYKKAENIAKALMADGWHWGTDGPLVLDIIELLTRHVYNQTPDFLKGNLTQAIYVSTVTEELNKILDASGVDVPRMDDRTEDFFFGWLVDKSVPQVIALMEAERALAEQLGNTTG